MARSTKTIEAVDRIAPVVAAVSTDETPDASCPSD
jgi:hypothetical protein